jgi:AcrR family transcriptional regulator
MAQSSSEDFDKIKEWDRSEDSSVKKDIILDAAEQVFSHKDYHDAVLDEIAGFAGVSKATLYLYFKSKIDLFLSVVERKLWELDKVVVNAIKADTNPVSAIKQLINDELQFFADNAAFFKVFYAQRSNLQLHDEVNEDEIRDRIMPFVLSKVDAVAGIIKRGQENNVFQSLNPKDAAVMLISLIHTCAALPQFSDSENVISIDDKADLVAKIFLEGLLRR